MKKYMPIMLIAGAMLLAGNVALAGDVGKTENGLTVKKASALGFSEVVDFPSHSITLNAAQFDYAPVTVVPERVSAPYRVPGEVGRPDSKRHFPWLARVIKLC